MESATRLSSREANKTLITCNLKGNLLTIAIAFHSRLKILLISPVLIIEFAALTCGRRRRAKIMNAFIGLFGVPSALSV